MSEPCAVCFECQVCVTCEKFGPPQTQPRPMPQFQQMPMQRPQPPPLTEERVREIIMEVLASLDLVKTRAGRKIGSSSKQAR